MRRVLLALLVLAGLGLWARGVVPCSVSGSQPACRAEFLPGPALDALDVVDLGAGVQDYASTGQLVFTTVRVDTDLTLGEWFRGLTDPAVELVDRDLVVPRGEDADRVAERNAARMTASQTVAALAALRHLGYEQVRTDGAEVQALAAETQRGFADGVVRVGDVLVAVDGDAVRDDVAATAALRARRPGDRVTLTLLRPGPGPDGLVRPGAPLDDAERLEVDVALVEHPGGGEDAVGVLGVELGTRVTLPLDVVIDAGEVGGPSAGLVFALAVVDRLLPDDLTGGGIVAGTGSIGPDGRVGEVGGIRQKVVGAIDREDGGPPATVFLAPASQLEEAREAAVDSEILLVPVETLGDAVVALRRLSEGSTPSGALAIGRTGSR